MRVSKPVRAAHRAALLEQAGRLFRARGLAAVGVAEVSQAAGLTHGAFYGHFEGKQALAAEAVRAALIESAALWRRRVARARAAGRDPVEAIVQGYLSAAHRDAPETGCALASLGAEMLRAGPPLADALRAGTEALLAELTPLLPDRARALAVLAVLSGGLALARALAADDAASRAALAAAARAAMQLAKET